MGKCDLYSIEFLKDLAWNSANIFIHFISFILACTAAIKIYYYYIIIII